VPRAQPLTTFIVFAQHTLSAGEVKPLSAAFVIPVSAQPIVGPTGDLAAPSAADTERLRQLASVLNADSSVPASILASPLTLDELGVGGPAARAALAQLRGATAGGPFQILPSTYSPVSLGALQTSLPGEIKPQLDTGSATLKSVFGVSPVDSTWVVDGPLDGATLGVLIAHHARQIIVPNGDLTPLPGEIQITFAGSTYLDYGGSRLRVISADSTLTAAFTRRVSPVLAANQLLAELAMIYTEAPNAISHRALAVLPPPGWSASATFVQVLLDGLQGNPLLSAVTASQLFSSMAQPEGTRYLSSDQPLSGGVDQAGSIATARQMVDELGRILGHSSQVTDLNRQILLAESSVLDSAQRRTVLGAVARATEEVRHAASLPPATTITLTATKGQIPLTILAAPNLHPHIQLHLRSQRLIFRPFTPREGKCTVLSDTEEVCQLTLTNQNTTLKVPVETRSSGVFPLDVSLEVPGTNRLLAKDRDTVRSTAVSGVAIIVIIAALLGLVLWWGRDLRRGRRPKGMVPSPLADPEDKEVTAGDPEVDRFFERPPPDLGADKRTEPPMSPSADTSDPSTTANLNGRARETRRH
jgi:hypothetical protein